MRRGELWAGSAVSLLLLASLGTLAVYHRRGGAGRVVLEEGLRDVVKHQKAIIAKETVASPPPSRPLIPNPAQHNLFRVAHPLSH